MVSSHKSSIEGLGDVVIVVSGTANAIEIAEGTSNVSIKNVRIERIGTGSEHAGGGLYIHGGARRIALEDVHADGCTYGIYSNLDGSVSRQIRLHRCTAVHNSATAYTSIYGLYFPNTHDLSIIDCAASGAWLDGLKLPRSTENVQVMGGYYSGNGVFGSLGPPNGGDGIDAFAGGTLFKIIGTVCEENDGHGIQIKTSEAYPSSEWGYIRCFEIIGVTCRRNTYVGLTINRSEVTGSAPLVSNLNIIGGIFEENAAYGIYLRCRSATVTSANVRLNASGGLFTSPESMDIDINGGVYAGNGFNAGHPQIGIYGRRITVRSPTLIGREALTIARNEDFGPLSMSGSYGIYVYDPSEDIKILDVNAHNLTIPIFVGSTLTASVLVRHSGYGAPSLYGGPGSTYHRLDGGASSSMYVKETASSRSDGWRAV